MLLLHSSRMEKTQHSTGPPKASSKPPAPMSLDWTPAVESIPSTLHYLSTTAAQNHEIPSQGHQQKYAHLIGQFTPEAVVNSNTYRQKHKHRHRHRHRHDMDRDRRRHRHKHHSRSKCTEKGSPRLDRETNHRLELRAGLFHPDNVPPLALSDREWLQSCLSIPSSRMQQLEAVSSRIV
jgi:hypothetical protein